MSKYALYKANFYSFISFLPIFITPEYLILKKTLIISISYYLPPQSKNHNRNKKCVFS